MIDLGHFLLDLLNLFDGKVLDELMFGFRPQTRKNGDLPNLSFFPRKPEPLGAEFKAICCAVSALMIWIEL